MKIILLQVKIFQSHVKKHFKNYDVHYLTFFQFSLYVCLKKNLNLLNFLSHQSRSPKLQKL